MNEWIRRFISTRPFLSEEGFLKIFKLCTAGYISVKLVGNIRRTTLSFSRLSNKALQNLYMGHVLLFFS